MEPTRRKLIVVGLGPAGGEWIPQRNVDALKSASTVLLRTMIHPSTQMLLAEGIHFESCDDLYETADCFESLYRSVAKRASELDEDAVFAVPGHPMVGEESVRLLSELRDIDVYPAPSFVDAVLASTRQPFSGALQVWNAHDPDGMAIDQRSAQIVYQLDTVDAASHAKLALMQHYPDSHPVWLVASAGSVNQVVSEMPLLELDRHSYDPLTSAYVPALQSDFAPGFSGLVQIVDALLGPDGCPWDREQTHESLKKHMVEETYEVLEAIDQNDPDALCEELGDFLLQAVMHAQMDAIEGYYDIGDVIKGICDKLVRRHPHVFGSVTVSGSDEVLSNWDAIKKGEKGEDRSVVAGVPRSMPALLRAHEISKRAVGVGFEWQQLEDVFLKLNEELSELKAAIQEGERQGIESEIGDLLFTIVNIARWLKVEPEGALQKMVTRFSLRFEQMESLAKKPLNDLSFDEWDALWNEAKKATNPEGFRGR
ncbi:MAG: nucleoside triphosphate pyrophosphohydrolase [Fimbriimonadales bacterium]